MGVPALERGMPQTHSSLLALHRKRPVMEQTTIVIEPLDTREESVTTRRRTARLRQFKVQSLFLLPALVIFTAFVIYPILGSLYYSLTDWDGLDPNLHFVGLANFQQMLSDPTTLIDLRNTLVF